jgi:hypothetical protein
MVSMLSVGPRVRGFKSGICTGDKSPQNKFARRESKAGGSMS